MAEPLKNHFGPEVPARLGDMIQGVYGEFDRQRFLEIALDGFEELELMDRGRHISAALAETLPSDGEEAIQILMASLGLSPDAPELTGMGAFLYLPVVFFVAERGLGCFETSMLAQRELTKRFTAEFSIRAFLEHSPERTLERLRMWATDPNFHVRRLVSEGTRPRLPWAPRLKRFQDDPGPVVALLELLKDDPEEYVRRSVANNLNDISKDHPELAVEIARRWWVEAGEDRKRLVRHALRTLVKKGHQGALGILGFGEDSPATVETVTCIPEKAAIGGKIQLQVGIMNPSSDETGALVDFRIHFVKASGSASPKVFKGGERRLAAGERATIRKTISVAQQSTRTHYPGVHRVEVMLNGVTCPGVSFELV